MWGSVAAVFMSIATSLLLQQPPKPATVQQQQYQPYQQYQPQRQGIQQGVQP